MQRVLVFHGYLLRGTGSNIYNTSLAQAMVRMGHEVHLLCQDPDWRGASRAGALHRLHTPDRPRPAGLRGGSL